MIFNETDGDDEGICHLYDGDDKEIMQYSEPDRERESIMDKMITEDNNSKSIVAYQVSVLTNES